MIFIAIIISAICQFLIHLIQTGLHLLDVIKSFLSLLHHSMLVTEYHHLRQIAYRTVTGYSHMTFSGILQACNYFQERGFTCTVFANQCDAILPINHESYLFKQRRCIEFHFQVIYRNHKKSILLP